MERSKRGGDGSPGTVTPGCRRPHRIILLVLLVVGASWALAGPTIAGHCGPTSDKDHLPDGSCGYWVSPVSPSPTAPPSPQPVTVENVPTVKVRPDPGSDSIPVTVENWPTPEPAPTTDGWNSSDRQTLQTIMETQLRLTRSLIFGLAVVLFALGGLLVLTLRRVR